MPDTTPAFATPEITDQPARNLAVIRRTVTVDKIADLYDSAFPQIFAALAATGVTASDVPMGVTYGMTDDTLDLAVAVPVASPFDGAGTGGTAGTVSAERIPASRTATLLVSGSYDQLAEAYNHLFSWLSDRGLTPTGTVWERYLTEPVPDGDPADNLTQLGVLVR